MEQREIEIFLTLAEELHFGRTAERLHVSTTRVSQTIRKVERQIGVPLFERTSRRVVLTPIGRHLEEGLRPAFQQTREVIARAIAAGRGVDGELVVGFVGTVVGRFLHSVGEVFQAGIRPARFRSGRPVTATSSGCCAPANSTWHRPFPSRARPGLGSGPVQRAYGAGRLVPASLRQAEVGHAGGSGPRQGAASGVRSRIHEGRPVPPYHPVGQGYRARPRVQHGPGDAVAHRGRPGHVPRARPRHLYDTRPEIVYVPISDGVPRKRVLIWRAAGETSRIRAFTQTAQEFVAANGYPLGP